MKTKAKHELFSALAMQGILSAIVTPENAKYWKEVAFKNEVTSERAIAMAAVQAADALLDVLDMHNAHLDKVK